MKKTLIILFLLTSYISHGQNFTFKRVFTQTTGLPSTFIKLEGEIFISDTTLIMSHNGVESKKSIVKQPNVSNDWRIFKVKINEDKEMRITIGPNPRPTKNEDYILIMETKDNFTNNISSYSYYLSSNK